MTTEAERRTLVDKLDMGIADDTLLATMRANKKDSGVKVPAQTQQEIYDAVRNGKYKVNYKGQGSECFCVCGYCECKCG